MDPPPDEPVIDVVEGGPFHMLDVAPKFPTMHPLAVVEPLMLSPRACRAIIPAADRADGASLSNALCITNGPILDDPVRMTDTSSSPASRVSLPGVPVCSRLFRCDSASMDLRGVYDQSVSVMCPGCNWQTDQCGGKWRTQPLTGSQVSGDELGPLQRIADSALTWRV